MPRPKGIAELLEDRRKRALALLNYGLSLNEVGRRIGSSASSVMRWRDAWRRVGRKALKVRFPLEAGQKPTPAFDRSAPEGADGAWLPNQSMDHRPHCRSD